MGWEIFGKFPGKYLWRKNIFCEVAGYKLATLKKITQTSWYFPENFAKTFRKSFPWNICKRLLPSSEYSCAWRWRSSHQRRSIKRGVLKNFRKLTERHHVPESLRPVETGGEGRLGGDLVLPPPTPTPLHPRPPPNYAKFYFHELKKIVLQWIVHWIQHYRGHHPFYENEKNYFEEVLDCL